MALPVVAVALVGATLAGCGGKDKDNNTGGSNAGGNATAGASAGPGKAAKVTVDKTVFFGGFKVEVGEATYTPGKDEYDPGTVVISATFENLGPRPATLDAEPALSGHGEAFESTKINGVDGVPQVPGGLTGKGNFTFEVDGDFTLDDAALTLGRGDDNQAVVPIGASGGKLVALEPVEFPLTGTVKVSNLSAKLLSGELRADVPEDHDQVAKGKLALTLTFDITNSSTYAGGYAFAFGTNIFLTVPDGTSITGEDGPIELLHAVSTMKGLKVRFVIDAPVEGSYGFGIRDDMKNLRGSVKINLPAFS